MLLFAAINISLFSQDSFIYSPDTLCSNINDSLDIDKLKTPIEEYFSSPDINFDGDNNISELDDTNQSNNELTFRNELLFNESANLSSETLNQV